MTDVSVRVADATGGQMFQRTIRVEGAFRKWGLTL